MRQHFLLMEIHSHSRQLPATSEEKKIRQRIHT
jgi:hypothetical protein